MTKPTCCLPDCDKPVYQTRPMCGSHYMKNWRYGDPYYKEPPRWKDRVGERFGALIVVRRGKNRWICLCDCGAETEVNTADLTRSRIMTCGNARIHWRSIHPTYGDIHNWLATDRGSARAHPCVDCGQPARQWSYDNADPDELFEASPTGREIRYSGDINHYEPRCIRCHKQFDMADRDRRGEPRTKRQKTRVGA